MTEQDADKLAAIRKRWPDDLGLKGSQIRRDVRALLRMLELANNNTRFYIERARQMHEAIVKWRDSGFSEQSIDDLIDIAASPPIAESSPSAEGWKAARYEAALREIADATACPCHCPTVMELAAAALEGGEGA